VRLISATHQNLAQCVMQGRFRQDLFYRLNVIDIRIPPLRERRDDIPLLARHLMSQLAPHLTLSQSAIDKLTAYDFPGNVRELGNILERSAALAESDRVDAEDLNIGSGAPALAANVRDDRGEARHEKRGEPPPVPVAAGANAIGLVGTLGDHLDQIERDLIEKALAQTRYNRTAAAALLGITFRQLRYRMQRLNIQ